MPPESGITVTISGQEADTGHSWVSCKARLRPWLAVGWSPDSQESFSFVAFNLPKRWGDQSRIRRLHYPRIVRTNGRLGLKTEGNWEWLKSTLAWWSIIQSAVSAETARPLSHGQCAWRGIYIRASSLWVSFLEWIVPPKSYAKIIIF